MSHSGRRSVWHRLLGQAAIILVAIWPGSVAQPAAAQDALTTAYNRGYADGYREAIKGGTTGYCSAALAPLGGTNGLEQTMFIRTPSGWSYGKVTAQDGQTVIQYQPLDQIAPNIQINGNTTDAWRARLDEFGGVGGAVWMFNAPPAAP